MSEQKSLPQLVQDAQKLVESNYPYLQGSGDIAEILQISTPHFIREFKKATGQSPSQYLILYKLEKSKKLLLTDNLYVDTVANLVGFSCGNYFAKVFRKHFHQTPSEYIAQNKGKAQENEEFPELYL